MRLHFKPKVRKIQTSDGGDFILLRQINLETTRKATSAEEVRKRFQYSNIKIYLS